MVTIAVITACYGNHDWLLDPVEQDGVTEYIAVVDAPQAGSCGMWTQVVEPRPHLHPRMAAKVPKCRPDLYTDADHILWVDANARFKHVGAAQWAVDHVIMAQVTLKPGEFGPVSTPFAMFPHPERIDITPEALVSEGMSKYDGQRMLEQTQAYTKWGLPLNYGLWACGFMARYNTREAAKIGEDWLAEQVYWTYQDQLSFPYVMWQYGLTPVELLEGNLWSNPHVYFEGHRQ